MLEDAVEMRTVMGDRVVFLHDVTTIGPHYQLPTFHKLNREAIMGDSRDLVFSKGPVQVDFLTWLKDVGLSEASVLPLNAPESVSLPERIVKNPNVVRYVRQLFSDGVMQPYLGDAANLQVADMIGLPLYANTELAAKYNTKPALKKLAQEHGFPVIRSIEANQLTLDAAIEEVLSRSPQVFVREELGTSGFGSYKVSSLLDDRLEDLRTTEGVYVVEPFVDVDSSPASTWFVSFDGAISYLGSSFQKLRNGMSYYGSRFEDSAVLEESKKVTRPIVEVLANEGYIGAIGFDLMQLSNGELYVAEVNPRMTGSIYISELLKKLQRSEEFKFAESDVVQVPQNMPFSKILEVGGSMVANSSRVNGKIVPYETGSIPDGYIRVVVTGDSAEETFSLLRDFEHTLADVA